MGGPRPRVVLVWAQTPQGVIGRGGGLPWGRLPADLRRFRALTRGKVVVMGRRTFDSIGSALPERENVVITRDQSRSFAGAHAVHGLEEALAWAGAAGKSEAAVIGGAEVYRAALPLADRLELTIVHADLDGDTRFPEVDWTEWRLVGEEHRPADAENAHPLTFRTYERA
jgi:dihydrofolate reductase